MINFIDGCVKSRPSDTTIYSPDIACIVVFDFNTVYVPVMLLADLIPVAAHFKFFRRVSVSVFHHISPIHSSAY